MKLSLGIVGLPNVGKSTLFNALTLNKVPAENYPFCTIDPNVGVVAVFDQRLEEIAQIEKSEKIIPAVIEFVDIAGLIKGASEGEGLGNKFLSNIKEVDAILHVVRGFDDKNVMHVYDRIDPKDDIETINTELILKDIESLSSRIDKIEKQYKAIADKRYIIDELKELQSHLEKGNLAMKFTFQKETEDIKRIMFEMSLLTYKPIIYLLNTKSQITEDEIRTQLGLDETATVLAIDILQEYEIATLDKSEKDEFKQLYGIEKTGIEKLTGLAYEKLGLISYFTAGPKEARAWTINLDENIRDAAAVIHNDFKDKFIAADVASYSDFLENSGWDGCKKKGKARLEGKEYTVKDGDIIIFRHGA